MLKDNSYVGKKVLCQAIAKRTKFTQADVNEMLNALVEVVKENLSLGTTIILKGFVTIRTRVRSGRFGFVPNKGYIDMPERTYIEFRSLLPEEDKDTE